MVTLKNERKVVDWNLKSRVERDDSPVLLMECVYYFIRVWRDWQEPRLFFFIIIT
jgi:hypothetical protein